MSSRPQNIHHRYCKLLPLYLKGFFKILTRRASVQFALSHMQNGAMVYKNFWITGSAH